MRPRSSLRLGFDPRESDDLSAEVVAPQVHGVTYRTFSRYTVREIFSTKREEIQQSIGDELRPKLAADGLVLKGELLEVKL